MDENELKHLIDSLDRKAPKDAARVRLYQYGGGPDESAVRANRAGYLRLGIEFLKAAFAHPKDDKSSSYLNVDIGYLQTPDSDVCFDHFERLEELKFISPQDSLKGKLLGIATVFIFIVGLILAVVGLITVIRHYVST